MNYRLWATIVFGDCSLEGCDPPNKNLLKSGQDSTRIIPEFSRGGVRPSIIAPSAHSLVSQAVSFFVIIIFLIIISLQYRCDYYFCKWPLVFSHVPTQQLTMRFNIMNTQVFDIFLYELLRNSKCQCIAFFR